MDSSKGHRQLLGLESPASEHQEFSQSETDMNEANRQRTALESTGDGFQEFVAFLDRIQYRKAKEMKLGRSEERSRREDLDVKVIKTKLPWIPSFEWEDFCVSAVKNSMSAAERNMCDPSANEPVSSEQKETWSSSDSPRQNSGIERGFIGTTSFHIGKKSQVAQEPRNLEGKGPMDPLQS